MNKIIATFIFIITAIFFMPAASASEISSPDLPAGSLMVSDDQSMGFPLKHTSVDAKISGYVAEVEVRQEYVNPYKVPIEAVYVFPLPNKAAIYDMEMKVGQKIIKSQIKTREEAKRIYEQAKEEGKRTGLLEQERPNIFTQSVANILPGDEITVIIRYTEELVFDENRYKFVFPMVVGPRYIPGGWLEENFVSGVTDYEKITPPYLKPEMRSGHDISLSLDINTGDIPITKISSVTHRVDVAQKSKSNAYVKIKQDDTIPNKDFVLEFELSGDIPQFAFFTHKPENGDGYFSLMIQPQTDFSISEVTPKEMFFVVDVSGSMSGVPIEKAKEAMTYALKNLNPEDTFYIIKFSSKTLRFSDKPLSNTPENIIAGLQYIDNIKARGGTEMVPGISEALKYRQDPNKLRLVVIMGDGYVGNEKEILAELQKNLGDQTRVFYFGIGSSSNRYLIDKVAEIGRGFAYYITLRDNSENVVEEFYERISLPLFTNLSIDWGGLEVEELYPNLIPDLFAGQPLYIHGKYKKPAKGKISVSGKVASIEEGLGNFIPKIFGMSALVRTEQQFFDISVDLPSNYPENEWVGRLWARSKIEICPTRCLREQSKA
ncbi:VWA domain-containing protein [Patescibacteria group bacterium]|nr:VWA domain-containing protein [Patescibacteria group bacterium]